jgi:hypothetical protein
VNPTDMTKGRITGKTINGIEDTSNNKLCSRRIVLCDVFCFVIEVLQRFA